MRNELRRLNAQADWPELLELARRAREAFPDAWDPDYYEARALIGSGRYEEADHLLLLAADRFPRNPHIPVLYGQCGVRTLAPEDAIVRWQSVVDRTPDAPLAYTGLAQAYATGGRLDETDRVLADGLAQTPDHIGLLVMRAEFASRRRDWTTAVEGWGAVRRLAPDRPDAVTKAITALRQLDMFDEAEELLREGLERFPNDPDMLGSNAQLAVLARDWPEAARRWRKMTDVAPDSLQATIGLAGALARQELPREADEVLTNAIRRSPDNERLLVEYARTAARARSWSEAAVRWRAVYDRCPPRPSTYLEFGQALEKSEEAIQAEEIASEGVGFAPEDVPLLIYHAKLAERRFDYPEAAKRLRAAAKRIPDDPALIEAMAELEETVATAKTMAVVDKSLPSRVGPRGSLYVPEPAQANDRVPQVGPTAADLLLTGAPLGDIASPVQPPEPSALGSLGGKMRRLFGRK